MAIVKTHQSPYGSSIDSLKAELASHINTVMTSRRLSRMAAAELTGTTRVRIHNLCKGDYKGCSLESMFEILIKLDNEIIVEVIPAPTAKKIRLVSRNRKD